MHAIVGNMQRLLAIIIALAVAAEVSVPAYADATTDCYGEDIDRRIDGCTALIEQRHQGIADLSRAYAMRGLAYSLKGEYSMAISDYDMAIRDQPDFAVALNNRAWTYFRWGKAEIGLPDVEKALQLNPFSPHSFDTRAHIRQTLGDAAGALSDYEMAMWYGGSGTIKVYQCGLKGLSFYSEEIDGSLRPEVTEALRRCVHDKACDPLPPGEKCP
jgi:tetratricopeptide (TPR) repeat protein